jgi:hypothetical protein
MRYLMIAVLLISASAMTCCVTTVDGTWVSGRVGDLSTEDIRAAVATARRQNLWGGGKPRQIDIVNQDEIHIYWTERKGVDAGHDILKRVKGKWRYEGRIIVVS